MGESKRKMLVMLVEPDRVERARIVGIFALANEVQRTLPRMQSRSSFYYEILECEQGSDVFRLHAIHNPDCIIINCGVSQPSGQEICAWIRQQEGERHTGIIFTAARLDGARLSIECLESGADDYLKANISSREFFARVNSVLKLKAMTDELRSANQKLKVLSNTDELSGLHNMRSFNNYFISASRLMQSGRTGLGVIMFDLDHFKQVNDSTNHLVGSFVIGEVGRLLSRSGILAQADCAARYGGDEYIVYTADNTADEVRKKGEAILEVIRKAAFIRDGFQVQITASVGVAWVAPGYCGKGEDLIKAADMMCYLSKRQGRNQVSAMVLASPDDLDLLRNSKREDEIQDSNALPLRRQG